MALPWLSLSRFSQKPISTLLIVTLLALSLHTLVRLPSSVPQPDPPFEVVLEDVDPDTDFVKPYRPVSSEHKQALGKHTLTPDGLLLVNPEGPHPIFQLMRDAEAAWDKKVARASKTLEEAVAEYRRRYRRAPPLGFDKWWDYVVKHRLQLPDEYDEIFDDIEPFWGIDPLELTKTQQELEQSDRAVTMEKTDAHPKLQVVHSSFPPKDQRHMQGTIDRILALIRDVEADLPPLRVTLSAFDNPSKLSDWQVKSLALEAAANGTTLTLADLPPVTKSGWTQACSPDSPARLHPPKYPPPSTPSLPPSSPKTFIASHRDTMNPCMHPSLLTSHGQFLSHKVGPRPLPNLVPRFSLCSTLLHHDVRPTVPYGWEPSFDTDPDEDDEEDSGVIPWERKTNDRLGWRGRTTGMRASPDSWWINGHRPRLVTLTNALEGNVSILRVPTDGNGRSAEEMPVGKPERVLLADVNPVWMDIAFTDEPVGCDKPRGTCDEMAKMWTFQEVQGKDAEAKYKFILDVDGNGWSGRFKRLITSNTLIFKATVYPEWFTSRIAPWVHYVPIQVSYADLYDAVSFFRVHDDLARQIAQAGRAWSRRYWRRQDMTAYLYRLLLEYARVTSLDRKKMDYVG